MKASVLLSCVLLAGSAPVAADVCKVRVTVAPDEVRPVIEAWVRAEASCSTDLEVRVVATLDGYYLYARDATGHVRERMVPDAQAVGVLIASWIADDAMPVVPPPAIRIAPPSATPREVEPGTSRIQPGGLSFTFGGITSLAKGYGVRAEAQWMSRGGWLLYGAASIGRTGMLYAVSDGNNLELYPTDARLAAGIGHAWDGERWGARLRIGVVRAKWSGDFGGAMLADTTLAGLETGVRVSRRITDRWSFVGGIDVAKLASVGRLGFTPVGVQPEVIVVDAPPLDVAAIAGLDVRL